MPAFRSDEGAVHIELGAVAQMPLTAVHNAKRNNQTWGLHWKSIGDAIPHIGTDSHFLNA
jgi:hypothetical protein